MTETVEKIEFDGCEFKVEGSLLTRVIRLSRTQSAKIIAHNAERHYWLVELENHSDTETGYRIATEKFVRERLGS